MFRMELRYRRLFRSSAAWALLAVAMAFGWQALTVHFNYGGNWTALFCTGATLPVPPALAHERIYTFSGSAGYDGQFYHYLAHDPFLRRGFAEFIDSPQLRCRRILPSLAAWILAAGRDEFVHLAMFVVLLASVFSGTYWLGRYASGHGAHPAWGLAFLFIPATLISIDRFTVDATFIALAAGFALYTRERSDAKLYLVLAAAMLTRETGLLLLGGLGLFLLWRARWRRAAVFATAALPMFGWYLYLHVAAGAYDSLPGSLGPEPVKGFFGALLHPALYPGPAAIAWTAIATDCLAMIGTGIAFVLSASAAFRRSAGPVELAGLLFVVMAVVLDGVVAWWNAYGHARIFSPLFLFLAVRGFSSWSWWTVLPLCMNLPRILLQIAPQVLEILRVGVPALTR